MVFWNLRKKKFQMIKILLILFGVIDLGKAVIAGKEDEMKKSQKRQE